MDKHVNPKGSIIEMIPYAVATISLIVFFVVAVLSK